MQQIGDQIGYKLQYRLTIDQNKLQQMVKDLIASYSSLGVVEPGVNLAKQEITIKLNLQITNLLKLKEPFFEQTRWQLLVK
ncbi:MAG: hypothetical protein J0M03_16085 [Acidobacteria bacterium]|nr:hypothetical protein [Acidobacteriota bacterium]